MSCLRFTVLCRRGAGRSCPLPLLSHAIQSLAPALPRFATALPCSAVLSRSFSTQNYAIAARSLALLCFAVAVRICSKPLRCKSQPCYAPASPFPALPLPCVTSLDPAMPQLCRSTQCSSIATHFPSEHSCAAASRFLESALPLQVLAVLCPCRADLFVALLCRCVS